MSGASLVGRDLISLLDLETEELEKILELAIEVKANPQHFTRSLAGKTLLMVTHSVEAETYADRILVLQDGRLRQRRQQGRGAGEP